MGKHASYKAKGLALIGCTTLLLAAGCMNDDADQVTVYTPRKPALEEVLAAEELAQAIEIMGTRKARVRPEAWFAPASDKGYYVGDTQYARRTLPQIVAKPALSARVVPLSDFDPASPRTFLPLEAARWDNIGWYGDGERTAIAGSDATATRIAVARYLQEQHGVRWWAAGEMGADYPSNIDMTPQPMQVTVQKPSFYSRQMYYSRDRAEAQIWGLRNGVRGHLSMNHALPQILGANATDEHPEWFPRFDGLAANEITWSRRRPPHPLYTSEAMAKAASEAAAKWFRANPASSSFSISPPDTSLVGDLEAYRSVIVDGAQFRGRPDLSNAFFVFANNVAVELAREFPERYLGMLAYWCYENLPDFALEAKVIPFLTADRSQWYDSAFREEDIALVRKWVANGSEIVGTWDYYYGGPFLVPRVLLETVKESIPILHREGVRAFFCELNPVWGYDAPKAWIAAQLLWNADADPAALEREFFASYFGPAEDAMLRFFRLADRQWMAQPGPARWIKYYEDADQALLFPPAILAELGALVDEALGQDLNPRYRERVQLVADSLHVTETYCSTYPAWEQLARWSPAQGVERLGEMLDAYVSARETLRLLPDSAEGRRSGMLKGSLVFLYCDDPLPGRLMLAGAGMKAAERAAVAARLPDYYAQIMRGRVARLMEQPFADGLSGWTISGWPETQPVLEAAGEGVVRFASANHMTMSRSFTARPGIAYGLALRADGLVGPASSIRLLMEFLDADGNTLNFSSDRLPSGPLTDATLAVAARAAKGTQTVRITISARSQDVGEQILLSAR